MIRTENLTIGYHTSKGQSTPLLSPLNARLRTGELTILLGPNGVGKSTLLKTLAGLIPPLDGNVWLQEQTISKWSATERAKKIGIVLSERTPATNLSVYDLVALGRSPYSGFFGGLTSTDKHHIDHALTLLQLKSLSRQSINELSDGQFQKVMLARVIAQGTPIILLDEPLAHLDLLSRIELLAVLRELASEHQKTILLSAHDLDLSLQMGDYIWLMNHQKQLKEGTPEDLVLQKAISAIYTSGNWGFNPVDGSITVLPANQVALTIYIQGNGLATHWTKKALTRKGFSLVRNPTAAAVLLQIEEQEEQTLWLIETNNTFTTCSSIDEVLQTLLRLSISFRNRI